MDKENILNQFKIVEDSINRAKLIIETDMCSGANKEVVLYELIKSYFQIENMVREIDPARFGKRTSNVLITPILTIDWLHTCPHCGDPDCQSDHK